MENLLIKSYLQQEENLDNFTIINYQHILHDTLIYKVTIEDDTTKIQKIYDINNLQLLSFIYNSSQKTFFKK